MSYKRTEYLYIQENTTATVTNERTHWKVVIEKNSDPLGLFQFGRYGYKCFNTKKRCVEVLQAVERGEVLNKELLNKLSLKLAS